MDDLKRELKDWEHDFIVQNNRSPKKSDIDNLPEIKLKYKNYSKLKRKLKSKNKINHNETPRKQPHNTLNHAQTPRQLESQEYLENNESNKMIEIGPTPQIFGRSISIFDMSLSPIRKKLDLQIVEENEDAHNNIESDSNSNDTDNIRSDNEFNKAKIPDINITTTTTLYETDEESDNKIETVNELMEDNDSVFQTTLIPPKHTKYGPNSPLKVPDLKFSQLTPGRKPDNDGISFSPSPLWKRSLNKSLIELENEFQTIRKELRIEENDEDVEKPGNTVSPSEISESNEEEEIVYNGKPKKRRRILKRNQSEMVNDSNNSNINLHAMLRNLKKKQLKEFLSDELPGDELEFEDVRSDKDEDVEGMITANSNNAKTKKKRPKKYNLVSNNFRRLKLPTRSRRGNPRWKRNR